MAQPWLDDLSEDWEGSDRHLSSSPSTNRSSLSINRQSVGSNVSASRIPRATTSKDSRRSSSTSGSYLRPRSTKGLARANTTAPVLTERSPSELNVAVPQTNGSGKSSTKASTLPRRTSSAFNDSVSSVQHHTVKKTGSVKDNTPEWKRRLERGQKAETDLFGPTPLEGIFQQPAQKKTNASAPLSSDGLIEEKPWAMPVDTSGSFDVLRTSQSMRSSRITGRPSMDVLKEETEEESDKDQDHSLLDGDAQEDSVLAPHADHVSTRNPLQSIDDPRLRTVSGQEEVRNEDISPITMSKQNTLNERLLKGILGGESAEELRSKLEKVAEITDRRPSSRASDNNVPYGRSNSQENFDFSHHDFGDITSHSLPDDLSMGTDDFASKGGFVNTRRGGYSDENSFMKRNFISSSADHSRQHFRSSPPPYVSPHVDSVSDPIDEPTLPETPSPKRPQTGQSSPERPRSSGSPLKLFGEYDTYTKDRLSRRLSQFEDEKDSSPAENSRGRPTPRKESRHHQDLDESFSEEERQMSQFGKGDLNDYPFTQSATREGPDSMPQSNESTPSQPGTIFKQTFHYESTKIPKPRDLNPEPANIVERTEEATLTIEIAESKRGLSSPGKERTPKRRRTFLRDELEFGIHKQQQEITTVTVIEHDIVHDSQPSEKEGKQVAGRKRKDARYEGQGPPADPDILASRQILRPRSSGNRQSSQRDLAVASGSQGSASTRNATDENMQQADSLTHAVAHELASFRETFGKEDVPAIAPEDIRKPSITTQDYFAEATKVMEMIRQNRGPPRSGLSSVEAPATEAENSEIQEDDFPSTMEQFSRPPSREGGGRHSISKSVAQPNPRVASHLRKFVDPVEKIEGDDVEHWDQDLPESDPPNIRIRNHKSESVRGQSAKQRRPSSNGGSVVNTSSSHGTSTSRSVPTALSGSSGDRGFITSNKVNLPTQVGGMVFDQMTKTWVKSRTSGGGEEREKKKSTSEEDPFDDIPDLTVDELEELKRSRELRNQVLARRLPDGEVEKGRPRTRDGAVIPLVDSSSAPSKVTRFDTSMAAGPVVETRATSWATTHLPTNDEKTVVTTARLQMERDEEVEHEIQMHEGRISKAPNNGGHSSKQPRAVTITFSSPLVSGIVYRDASPGSSEQTPSFHDLDHVGTKEDRWREESQTEQRHRQASGRKVSTRKASNSLVARRNSNDKVGFVGRPVSRIDEEGEDLDMSLVHVPASTSADAMTPMPANRAPPTTSAIIAAKNDSSLICLTPLSEFTFHQNDTPLHLDFSYVASRTHPTSLQQAHGQFSLAVDDMVRAITDVEPYEPYWDHIRRLDLSNKDLKTLHSFAEYCTKIEELCVKDNNIGQVAELPSSLRTLDIRRNCLSELSSWSHLGNLQYLDVSGNPNIDCLDVFNGLRHLRELRANDCGIREIDSMILEGSLDGLLSLTLCGNRLTGVMDFEGAGLTRLTHLDMANNNISSVINLDCLPALTHLDLSSNQINDFRMSRSLKNLQTLKLSDNQLETLDLIKFPVLKLLYIDGNHLRGIRGLEGHRNLETLSLRSQKTSSSRQAPSSPGLLVSILTSTPSDLRKLYLSANPLPQSCSGMLPPLQHPLLNLQYLDIASCGIASLPSNFGKHLPNLRTVNLNFNALKDLGALKGVMRLNKLLCAGNRIERMRRTMAVLETIGGRGEGLNKADFRGNGVVGGFYAPWDPWRGDKNEGEDSSKSNRHLTAVVEISEPIDDDDDDDDYDDNDRQGERHWEDEREVKDPFTLPQQSKEADVTYSYTLDESTRLKRRIWELLLIEKCPGLKEVDGLEFPPRIEMKLLQQALEDKEREGEEIDHIWERLLEYRVVRKTEVGGHLHVEDEKEWFPEFVDISDG